MAKVTLVSKSGDVAPIVLDVPDADLEALQQWARKSGRTIGQAFELVLEQWLDGLEQRFREN